MIMVSMVQNEFVLFRYGNIRGGISGWSARSPLLQGWCRTGNIVSLKLRWEYLD